MPEDRPLSISTSSQVSPDEVARRTFRAVRRGFDPEEVRTYLEEVARQLRSFAERESDIRRELADAEHRAANPVLDEATLTDALGHETARVLRSAHDAANEVVAKAETAAAEMRSEAREELDRAEADAAALRGEAREEIEQTQERVEAVLAERQAQSEATVAEHRRRAQEESASIIESAHIEAESIVDQGRNEAREMVEEAQALRSRVLADLSRRRKVLHAQIEQLRAGREHLAETVRDVRRSIDSIADELFRAEDEARLAAEAAGRESVARTESLSDEEVAAALLADEAAEAEAARALEGGADEAPGTDDGGSPTSGADAAVDGGAGAGSGVDADDDDAGTAVDGGDDDATGDGDPVMEPEPGRAVVISGAEVAGEAAAGSGPDGGTGAPAVAVDALFAKIRAGTGGSEVDTDDLTDPVADTDAGADGDAGVTETEDGEDGEPGGGPAADGELVARRDELVGPIVTALARRLKRNPQDDQNEVLDRLRGRGSVWSPDVLPEETEHHDRYVTAALPHLEAAGTAGATFVGPGDRRGPGADELLVVAGGLAEAIVAPLRRKLLDDGHLAGADDVVVVEHVGAAFREWKGERIERLAGDHVVEAFSAGTLLAAGEGTGSPVEWLAVATDGSDPCPDCHDNALNGPLDPGEEFPTGHRRPPAHPGCRCLLAPSAT
jgi:DivIVA domain-containing protein